jgi:hypothetical protein
MKYVFMFLVFLSFNSYAGNVYDAANSVVSQSSKDDKCRVFFKYYLEYLNNKDSGRASALIMLLDEKQPGLVDYCDARRSKYL